MAEEPDVIREQIDETRSSLTQKLETLESQVRGTVQNARATVEETIETVKCTVENTVNSVKQTFDLPYQVRQHPWGMVGGAAGVGFVLGAVAYRLRGELGRLHPATTVNGPTPVNLSDRSASGVASLSDLTNNQTQPSFLSTLLHQFDSEIGKVKEVAIGTAMALARDWVKQSVPQLAPHIDEIMNSATAKLGGRPINEPLMQQNPLGGSHDDGSGGLR